MVWDNYVNRPLTIPLPDGVQSYKFYPLVVSLRLEFAERLRRQGKGMYIPSQRWGIAGVPARLRLDNAVAYNAKKWYRNAEPIDLTSWLQWTSTPHDFWKWRICVEPAGLTGSLYDITNPSGGGGASVMAEDLFHMDGRLLNLPNPFSAPSPNIAFVGNLQFGITTDGGATVSWLDPFWN